MGPNKAAPFAAPLPTLDTGTTEAIAVTPEPQTGPRWPTPRNTATAAQLHAAGRERRAKLIALVAEARKSGAATSEQQAAWLNERGHYSPRGLPWSGNSLRQGLHRRLRLA